MRQWIAAYGPAALWAAGLFWLGSRPHLPMPETSFPLDKPAHFIAYGILGALVARGRQRANGRPGWLWLLLAASLVGVLDELNQMRVPGRSPALGDWVADTAGILLALGWARRRRENGTEGRVNEP